MSTRATYTINDGSKTHHFYIHYDGYSEGAAEYFYNLFTIENKRGGLAEQFIRANKYAEFTTDPSHHGDTEFHYTLNEKGDLVQEAYEWNGASEREMSTTFTGKAWEFVNKFKSFNDDDSALTYIKHPSDHVDIFSIGSVFKDISSKVSYIRQYPHFTGNALSNAVEIFKLAQLVIVTYDELENGQLVDQILLSKARHISDVSDHMKTGFHLIMHCGDSDERKVSLLETIKHSVDMIESAVAA